MFVLKELACDVLFFFIKFYSIEKFNQQKANLDIRNVRR